MSATGYQGKARGSTPRFQQRHYEAVASTLRDARRALMVTVTPDTLHVWQNMVDEFVIMFRRDNPNFMPDRFRTWCNQ